MDAKIGFCDTKLGIRGFGMLFGWLKIDLDKSMPTKTSLTFIQDFLDRFGETLINNKYAFNWYANLDRWIVG